jgi:hypothetical protein
MENIMPQQAKIQVDGIRETLTDISKRLRQIREGKSMPASTEYERQGDRISVRIVTGPEAAPKAASKKPSG